MLGCVSSPSFIENFRYQLVDYLTNNGIYEWVIMAGKPREVSSLNTIGLTFDMFTWVFVTISDISVAFLLFIIDLIWNNINNYYSTKMTIREHGHQGMCQTIKIIYI